MTKHGTSFYLPAVPGSLVWRLGQAAVQGVLWSPPQVVVSLSLAGQQEQCWLRGSASCAALPATWPEFLGSGSA